MSKDYSEFPNFQKIDSSYQVHQSCQIENLGWLLEQLPKPFGKFDPAYRGTFVDVGAFDGITYSNVYQFAKAGWSGIMIEPMPENVAQIKEEHKDRPNVKVEMVACGDRDDGVIEMFFEREGSRIAKSNQPTHKIRTLTLNTILTLNNWNPDFDMLVVDTEDYEQPVLNGFDLAKWKPKLCIIETHHWQRRWIQRYFSQLYRIYYEDGLNSIFVRRDWSPGGDHPSPWPADQPDQ